jgi:ankyrin repeat protein
MNLSENNKNLLDILYYKRWIYRKRYSKKQIYAKVNKLLENGADPNIRNKYSMPILITSFYFKYYDIVILLLSHKANPNIMTNDKLTTIIEASLNGHTEIVRILINANSNVNQQNTYGINALIVASQRGHTDIVKLLLSNNADPNIIDCHNFSPLTYACEFRYLKIIKILLLHNSNINNVNIFGNTPLLCTAMNGYSKIDTKIVKLLLNNNANLNIVNNDNKNALYYSIESNNIDLIEIISLKMIEYGSCIRDFPIEIYKFSNIIKKIFWTSRKSYINLVDGLINLSNNMNSIIFYLGNELILKEICTYL